MKPGIFREEYIAIIICELLRGLQYLHTKGKYQGFIYLPPQLCHAEFCLNFTAENILLSASGDVKLADFGVS